MFVHFFNSNSYFRSTWDYDFANKALADKRIIAEFRSKHGRWVDYIIEFARGIDNLVGYCEELAKPDLDIHLTTKKLDYYLDVFLQDEKKIPVHKYIKEIEMIVAIARIAANHRVLLISLSFAFSFSASSSI